MPKVKFGNTQAVGQSKFGIIAVIAVVHPEPFDAVTVTEAFLEIPVIMFPETVPRFVVTPLDAFETNSIL